jgi:glycerol-3-phosphate dehydrogenase (NAD+)
MVQYSVCVVGSGNWGSVIAKIVGYNVQARPKEFVQRVPMYVYEELVDGQKLTEIINTQHENVKYLPGCRLPDNVVAIPDVVEAVTDADIVLFVTPHQFVRPICKSLKGKIKPTAIAVSLIKGLDVADGRLQLISTVINQLLGVNCAVLMGANVASEVAVENFCEATIGCNDENIGGILKHLFQASYFRVTVVPDLQTVELCGALKNIVAMGAGFVDGLRYVDNTKAAVIRLGFMEMFEFCRQFFENPRSETFLESCGFADLVTTCYSGRNRRVAAVFATSPDKTIDDLEKELLNGQKLQGPPTAAEVNVVLREKGLEHRFPLFTAVHKICARQMAVEKFVDCLKDHPEHL